MGDVFKGIIISEHINNDGYLPIHETIIFVNVSGETYSNTKAYDNITILIDVWILWETVALKIRGCNRRTKLRNRC